MVSPSPAAKATASRNPIPEIAPRPTAWLKSKTRPAAIVVSIAPSFYHLGTCTQGCATCARGRLAHPARSRPASADRALLLQKSRFLERAFDNGLGVDMQPVLQDGGVQATQVHRRREVTLGQVFRLPGRLL